MKRWMHSNFPQSPFLHWVSFYQLWPDNWWLLNHPSIWNLALGAGEKSGIETGVGGDAGPFPQIPFLYQGNGLSKQFGENGGWGRRLLTQGREKHQEEVQSSCPLIVQEELHKSSGIAWKDSANFVTLPSKTVKVFPGMQRLFLSLLGSSGSLVRISPPPQPTVLEA